MRIIAGNAGGRLLLAPKGMDTRPTQDKVKESLFSILQGELADARVLDLFAGSGALGLEAISRGAAFAVFCDKARPAQQAVWHNVEALGFAARCELLRCPWQVALRKIQARGDRFDIVFLDPPYRMADAGELLAALLQGTAVTEQTLVVYEHAKALPPPTDGWRCVDHREYGDTAVTFLRKKEGACAGADNSLSGFV